MREKEEALATVDAVQGKEGSWCAAVMSWELATSAGRGKKCSGAEAVESLADT